MNNSEELEFDILGYQVKFKRDDKEINDPERVVEVLRNEIEQILRGAPNLEKGQALLLAALKLCSDKVQLEDNFRQQIHQVRNRAQDALNLIQEVVPAQPEQ